MASAKVAANQKRKDYILAIAGKSHQTRFYSHLAAEMPYQNNEHKKLMT